VVLTGHGLVAQPGSAEPRQGSGRRFKSGRGRFVLTVSHRAVAQLVAHKTGGLGVAGSSPARPTVPPIYLTCRRSSTDQSTRLRIWGLGVQIPSPVLT
jgi:hypothetical protein